MIALSFTAQIHVFEGVASWENPQPIEVAFACGRKLRLRGGVSGEGIRIDELPLEAFDMDEYGHFEIHDVTTHFGFKPSAPGCVTRTIHNIYNELIGLAFPIGGEKFLCIWGAGDELWWGSQERLLDFDWLPNYKPRITGLLSDIA